MIDGEMNQWHEEVKEKRNQCNEESTKHENERVRKRGIEGARKPATDNERTHKNKTRHFVRHHLSITILQFCIVLIRPHAIE